MLERGQKVQVRFTGLEEDFELGLKNGLEYEIVGIDPASTIDFYYARMKRTGSETTPGFDEFLARFINGNKRRYKVNLDNTLDAVLTKGYEQYYLPRVSSLFSFICVNDKKLTPKLLLTTENNAYIHYYFSDEERRSVLPSILNTQRISSILARKGQVKSTLLYSFSHTQNGKVFFYSATDIELATYPKLRSLFFPMPVGSRLGGYLSCNWFPCKAKTPIFHSRSPTVLARRLLNLISLRALACKAI